MSPEPRASRANRFSTEVRALAVRMILEHEHEYANQSAAIMVIAPKIGCGGDTLRRWVKQSDIDSGRKEGKTSDERAQIKAMKREIRDLQQANEMLTKASAYFAQAELAAASNDDCLHKRAPQKLGCRADLQGFANRPIHILCACSDRPKP